jgi:hypothetical protein
MDWTALTAVGLRSLLELRRFRTKGRFHPMRVLALTKDSPQSGTSFPATNDRSGAGELQITTPAMRLNRASNPLQTNATQGGWRGLRAQAALTVAVEQAGQSQR